MATGTRERIIETTAGLFGERGYTATGLKAVARGSGATFGSLYHFFPGGKQQLAAEALRTAAARYEAMMAEVLGGAPDVVTAVQLAFESAAATLQETDYVDACPIATVALEVASSNEVLRLVAAEIFAGWLDSLQMPFIAAGVDPGRARELAILFLGALEGGFLLSRTAKSVTPLLSLGRSVTDSVERAVADLRRP
ncbi:MAG: TetR/AcrR family transcriptional regulator [Acidimicrobiales bacterium]